MNIHIIMQLQTDIKEKAKDKLSQTSLKTNALPDITHNISHVHVNIEFRKVDSEQH